MAHRKIKGLRQKVLRITAAIGVVALLGGCALFGIYDPEYVKARQANLDAAITEFDADSIGEVICESSGGKVALNNGFTHDFVFSGSDSLSAIVDRLSKLKYRIGSDADTSPYIEATRTDGIGLAGRLIVQPGDQPDIEEQLLAQGCSIPSEGAVYVGFREGDAVE